MDHSEKLRQYLNGIKKKIDRSKRIEEKEHKRLDEFCGEHLSVKIDLNMDNLLFQIKQSGEYLLSLVKDYRDYYKGFKVEDLSIKLPINSQNQWINCEEKFPEDDLGVLVSWWDYSNAGYHQPIRAYWDAENAHFYALDTMSLIPIEAEIWCSLPEVPEEKL